MNKASTSKPLKIVLYLFLVHLFCYGFLNAQDSTSQDQEIKSIRKNSFYFEILGNGVVWSINYERIFPLKDKMAMFLRVGGNEYHGEDTNDLSFNIIGATGILYGGPKNFLDVGVGYTYMSGFPDRLVAITAGYRYQALKGFLLRVSPMYICNSEKGDTFGNSLWVGLSLGYCF